MSKKIIILIGILGLLMIGVISGTVILERDSPPPEDSDLWLPKVEVPKKENAYYQLNKVKEKIHWPSEKMELINNIIQGKEWDVDFVEELLKNNEEAFDCFEKALIYPKFQLPEFQDVEALQFIVPLPSLREYRQLAKLEAIKALYLFKQGQQKEAFEQAIKVVRLAHLIQDSPRPILIQYLVGIAIKEIGLGTLRTMIPNTTLPPDVLKNYAEELADYKTNKKGLAAPLKAEYMALTKGVDDLAKGDFYLLEESMGEIPFHIKLMIRSGYFYKPNQTKRIFAEHYRKEIGNLNKNYYNEIERYSPTYLMSYYPRWMGLLVENSIGKIFYDTAAVILAPPLFEKKCQDNFSIIGTQLLMAIKAYQVEMGKMPISLDELMPKYISEVPKDPFDGKPIRFSPEKKIIYSVGSDLTDSGGSEGEDWKKMKDPTFEIGF